MRAPVIVASLALLAVALAWILRGASRPDPHAAVGPKVRAAEEAPAADLGAQQRARRPVGGVGSPPSRVAAKGLESTPEAEPEPDAERAVRRVVGRLVESESGRPLPGHRLEFSTRFVPGRTPTTTDAQGRFELERPIGEQFVLHRPAPGDAAGSVRLRLDPFFFELLPGEADVPHELTIRARRPPLALEVDVLHENGSPAAGVYVRFIARIVGAVGDDSQAVTDARGRARLGVWQERFEDASVRAWDAEGRASEVLSIESPFDPYLRRLVLAAGGEIAVRVRTERGEVIADRQVWASNDAANYSGVSQQTDALGEAVFTGLHPGAHTLGVYDARADSYVTRAVEVRPGERESIEVVLAEGQLAVGGRVLDEEGRPLPGVELVVLHDNGLERRVRTDEQGRYAYVADFVGPILISPNRVADEDRFEPDERLVPYGTRDADFQRLEESRKLRFDVEVVDRLDGEEITSFTATIDRGPGTERWSDSWVGRRTFELPVLAETRWHIAANGYLVHTLDLARELAALEPDERLRIELQRGLDHWMRVLDVETDEPIGGVVFRSPTAGEARSDAEGRVHFVADHWSVYRVEKEGYEPETWDPDEHVRWAFGPLHLTKSRE